MSNFARELRHAWRRLRRAPAFTITTFIVLALGLGATTAIFSVVYGILLRPLPYPHPERLMVVSHSIVVPGVDHVDESDATFMLYQAHNTVFDGLGAYREMDLNLAVANGGAAPERVSAAGVSASLLPTLGIAPAAGRTFSADDDRVGAPKVVILSDQLWRRKFGGDRGIVGKTVVVDGAERQVVGIMPASFHYPTAKTELWYPLQLDPRHSAPGSFNYIAVGRLKPNVTAAAATAELTRILPRLLEEYPSDIPPAMFEKVHLRPVLTPLRDVMTKDVRDLLWILFGAVGLVLVIACANVADLFLVRAEGRQRELAVRNALGAQRGTLLAQHMSEALVLASLATVAALLLAAAGVRVLSSLPSGIDVPRLTEVGVDGVVLLFALVVAAISAFAVSLVPLLRARRIPIAVVLRESGRSATVGREKHRARSALVVAQVALALVLVAASGLLARSFERLRTVTPGITADGLSTMRLALTGDRYQSVTPTSAFYTELLDRLRAIPGVRSAALTTWLPLTDDNNNGTLQIEDHPQPPNSVPPVHDMIYTTCNYFATAGVPLLAGRTLGTQDPTHPLFEAVVSRAFAEQYWHGGTALGKRVRPWIKGPWFTIVGVAGDVHFKALDQPAEAAVYFPIIFPEGDSASASNDIAVVIRSGGGPANVLTAARGVVQSLDPGLPTYSERSMTEIVRAASARARFLVVLLAVASAIALVLGAVGLYGVMAYGVSLRQREIGVRMALGAPPSEVSRMISRQGVILAGAGVVVGLAAAFATTRLLRGLLYDISPTDPLTLGGTVFVLLVVAFVASWLPARRAAGVDPAVVLRAD
ncbi:MAG TPA: ABC transporter permease [Gemmatimonadaceae bacterium]|nr:ABC transporter permease [Gemmatimonadaceae bacterium]